MKIIWLGQAGLLIHAGGKCIMIDPYLSDSVGEANPQMRRRVPVDSAFLTLRPDILAFTHGHLDHYDPQTAEPLLAAGQSACVLAPEGVWSRIRQLGGPHNYVLFRRHTVWTQDGIRFTAVYAEHSDPGAIGILLEAEGHILYITGDTLYNTAIFPDLPTHIDALFLPINGVGNNMGCADAVRFAQRVEARRVVPLHFGLMDDLDPKTFCCANRVIPKIYQEIHLGLDESDVR